VHRQYPHDKFLIRIFEKLNINQAAKIIKALVLGEQKIDIYRRMLAAIGYQLSELLYLLINASFAMFNIL